MKTRILQNNSNLKDPALIDDYYRDIANRGRVYQSAPLPPDLQIGEMNKCFQNALIQAIHKKWYLYVEGIAIADNEAYAHAWLTDRHRHYAYDVTWQAHNDDTGENVNMALPAIYKGVVLNTEACWDYAVALGRFGAIANRERRPRKFRAILRRSDLLVSA